VQEVIDFSNLTDKERGAINMTNNKRLALELALIAGLFISTANAEMKQYHAIRQSPCSVNLDAAASLMTALKNNDEEALEALVAKGKVILLPEGKRFAGLPFEYGLIHGYVKSGSHIGDKCYAIGRTMAE
jgi:hypothetical protein